MRNWGLKMTDKPKDDFDLDELFSSARRDAPVIRDEMLDLLISDALAAQSALTTPSDPPPQRPGWWQQVQDAFGGWAGLGGLVAASLVGLWIGVAPPATGLDPAMLVYGETGGYDDLFETVAMPAGFADE